MEQLTVGRLTIEHQTTAITKAAEYGATDFDDVFVVDVPILRTGHRGFSGTSRYVTVEEGERQHMRIPAAAAILLLVKLKKKTETFSYDRGANCFIYYTYIIIMINK